MTTLMDVESTNVFLSYNVAASLDLGGVSQLVAMFKPTFIFLQEVTLDSDSLVMVPGLYGYRGVTSVSPSQALPPYGGRMSRALWLVISYPGDYSTSQLAMMVFLLISILHLVLRARGNAGFFSARTSCP